MVSGTHESIGSSVLAERTDCHNDSVREIEVFLRVSNRENGERWIVMAGGPTGYESIVITEESTRALSQRGWVACFGTKNRWDRLTVSAGEMRRFLMHSGLFVEAA